MVNAVSEVSILLRVTGRAAGSGRGQLEKGL